MAHTSTPLAAPRSLRATLLATALAAVLAACGGGASDSGGTAGTANTGGPATTGGTPPVAAPDPTPSTAPPTAETRADAPADAAEASRFLTQSTFGPTDAAVAQVQRFGYTGWINDQVAKPSASHRLAWEAENPGGGGLQSAVNHSFWKQAVTGEDQLRQRVAFALSEIFVVSLQDGVADVRNNPHGVAAYLDLLSANAFGNYRDLLEAVSLNPMMATFLSSLKNQKADPATGRVPDENYAREVMQLFSIGLWELNADGSQKMAGGLPIATYGPSDVAGLAKVFTGWGWHCTSGLTTACWTDGNNPGDANLGKALKSLAGYPEYHSTQAKTFLGKTLPAQTTANPAASLKFALDTLFNHPNVGPFIGKQLIQRLVTSNPSPAYVATVAAAFNNNGSGVRGDMKAVVRAILMHPDAKLISTTSGKLREPVLKLSAMLRAFGATSTNGKFLFSKDDTDNPGTQLGQSPLYSPSVFNFFRPGYVPPGTLASAQSMAVPEMQIAHETSVAGYVNFMLDVVQNGIGANYGSGRDVQPNYTAEMAVADVPATLVARMNTKLMYGTMPAALKTEIENAVASVPMTETNARLNRVKVAVFLTLISPEFQVQK